MSQIKCISTIVAVFCFLSGSALAQTEPMPVLSCINAPSMNFNATLISGAWYELARHPAPNNTVACVEVEFTLEPDNTTLSINVTYASDTAELWKNQTTTSNVTLVSTGNNVTYELGSSGGVKVQTWYKLLDSDYNNYAFVCGYTNESDPASSFGLILARQRMPNWTELWGLEANASSSFSDFQNGTMYNVTQTEACYRNGSAANLPMLTAIFAALYALLKFIH